MTQRKEIRFINFLKGGLIFLVVLGHLLKGEYTHLITDVGEINVRGFIYLFHMPLFFFLSGHLFKLNRTRVEFYGWLKQLFLIFFTSIVVYQVIMVRQFSPQALLEMFVAPFNHLWYLWALLCFGVVMHFVFEKLNFTRLGTVLLILAATTVLLNSSEEFWNTSEYWFVNKVLLRPAEYFFYFFLAIFLRKSTFKEIHKSVKYIFFLIAIVLLFFEREYYFSCSLIHALGSMLFNLGLILLVLEGFRNYSQWGVAVVDDLGKNSLFIYLWHYALIIILEKFIHSNNLLLLTFEAILITLGLHYLHEFINSKTDFKYKLLFGFRHR